MSTSRPGLRFVAGGTVQAGHGAYIDRPSDAMLLRWCREGRFAYVLTSRQMGKSSLMVRTAESLIEEGVRPIIVDLTELGTSGTADQWYRGILQKIAEQLDLAVSVGRWWEEHERHSLAHRFTGFLTDVALRDVHSRIVVFVDEIDTTLRLDYSDDFFASIRYLYNARAIETGLERLSFVLLGVASPSELIKDAQRTPFNIGEEVVLDDFTEDEAVRDLEVDRALVRSVFRFTSGHPYLTLRVLKSLSETPLEGGIERRIASLFFGESAERDSNLQFVRDMLTTRVSDREAVLLRYRAIRRGKRIPNRESDSVCVWLRLSGIVRNEDGVLRVRNDIYRTVFDDQWIRRNRSVNWARLSAQVAAIAVALLIVVAAVLAPFAYVQRDQAVAAREIAIAARETAEQRALEASARAEEAKQASALVDRRLKIAQDAILLKRTIFFRRGSEFDEAVRSSLDPTIAFRATRQEHPYRSKSGLPTFTFRMFPEGRSIPGGLVNLALVTYRMDHSSFPNSLITAGPDRSFAGSYDGVGCLSRVTVLLEYIDPDRSPAVSQFDQCALIEAEPQNAK